MDVGRRWYITQLNTQYNKSLGTPKSLFQCFIENQLLSPLFYQKTKGQIKIKPTLTKSIFLLVLWVKPRILSIVAKFSTTKLQPQPKQCYIIHHMLVGIGKVKIQICNGQEKIETTMSEMINNISLPHGPSRKSHCSHKTRSQEWAIFYCPYFIYSNNNFYSKPSQRPHWALLTLHCLYSAKNYLLIVQGVHHVCQCSVYQPAQKDLLETVKSISCLHCS